jgi:O-antigen ligase
VPNIPITTDLTWPAAARRLADPLRIAAFALAVLALEVVLAHGIAGAQISKLVFLFVGLFAIAFVFRFPLPTALVFLALTDFIFYPTFFSAQIGPLSIRPHELALAGLLALAVLRPQRRTWGGTTGTALAVFLALVALSAAWALGNGSVSITEAFNWSRALFSLTFFYVVVRLFPSTGQRRVLLLGAAVAAAATGVVAAMVALGAGFGEALQAPGGQTIRAEGGFGSIERVRLPGLSAGYALFWYVAVQVAARDGTKRLGWAVLLAGIALDVVISFNRNMWVGIVLGLALMSVLGGARIRNRIAVAIAVLVAAVGLFVVFGSSASSDRVVSPIVKRGATLFSPDQTTREGSLQDRAKETERAWASFEEHPLLGVGAGASFGIITRQPISSGSFTIGVKPEPQLFLHNQYLYLLLIAGLPGLIAFLLFLGNPVALAWRRFPRDPEIVACGVGIALIMVSSVVAIYFTVDDMTAMLGLLTGVIVADAQGRAADGRPSGLIGPGESA